MGEGPGRARPLKYRVVISPTALKMLRGVSDRRIRRQLADRINALAADPEKQGKPLVGELGGYRSVYASGRRYRIIYRVDGDEIVVLVIALERRREGDRMDIYALAQRLLRLRLIEPE